MITINHMLEFYIYQGLGGIYAPDHELAKYNLDNDENKNRVYLGTYFPRSYVEAYRIYDQLFSEDIVYKCIQSKNEISMLSVGSGTGGDLIGFVEAFNQYFDGKSIRIYSFDGNLSGLNMQRELILNLNRYMKLRNGVYLEPRICTFSETSQISQVIEANVQPQIDVIQSFKMGNEFYEQTRGGKIYYELTKLAEDKLSENGILVLEDVTIKTFDGFFMPMILANQVREYLNQNPATWLRCVAPVFCEKWKYLCREERCFMKKEYDIFHGSEQNKRRDKSKVTFRILAKVPLGEYLKMNAYNNACLALSDGVECAMEKISILPF